MSFLRTLPVPPRLVIARGLGVAIAYLVVALALFGLLSKTLSPLEAALAGLTLAVGATLPGAAVVRVLLPRAGVLHMLVLGTVIGLGLWSVGGFLSHLTGLFVIRWLPSVLSLMLWVIRPRAGRGGAGRFPLVAQAGTLVALLTMIPVVRTALASQPASWTGWVSLYPDLPFQAAIASEAAARVPQDIPWVAGTQLSYTWAYHSAMGVWSSTSGVPAVDLVFQVWPVVFAILIPALVGIVTWELTRIPVVAALAPVVFTVAHGLVVAPLSFQQLPLVSLSPTRDFGHLFMLLVVLCLSRLLGRRSLRALSPAWLATLFLATGVATAAKGSELPILLGGVIATLFVLLVTRRAALSDLVVAAVFGVAGLVGFTVAIPDRSTAQTLSWGPLTFLDGNIPHRYVLSIAIVVLLLGGMAGFWFIIARPRARVIPSLIVGTMLAGVLGLALLTQSGGSQNYFWQGVEPLVAIAIAWSGYLAFRRFGRVLLVAAVGVYLCAQIAAQSSLDGTLVVAIVMVLAIVAAVVVRQIVRARLGAISWRQLAVVALLLTQAAQIVALPTGQLGGSVSDSSDSSAIESSQLTAFAYIRDNSAPNDLVITNAHCRTGTVADGDCDARHFILAAVSQRRVLVEGWSYTQFGTSPDWVRTQLELSDGFIQSPTTARLRHLESLGVGFAYVDTRLAWSSKLDNFGTLVFQSPWARVYRLD